MDQRALKGPGRLGRFELLREIKQGKRDRVWLALDPRLQREVAIKLVRTAGVDAPGLAAGFDEARAVSRLKHPHIVPLFEADEHQGQAYLVFEYVPGPTLAEALRSGPPWPPRKCVDLLLGLLDGLEAAHEQGVVHRDLNPSNILVGLDGRARLMDFGIAGRIAGPMAATDAAGAGRVVGTPGYLSPEAARGMAPVPAMDVFSAAVVLAEMLTGRPLLAADDARQALRRVQEEDLQLPETPAVDALLRGVVQRALARDPRQRYDSARSFRLALAAWLQPDEAAPAVGQNSHATLEFLLRRMRHRSDFPALSGAVVRIQQVAASESDSIPSLTKVILEDVALTHKLLRLVNTAHYSAVAAGGVGTVSRAVALIGFSGIRNMALSLVLLDHIPDKAHATQLHGEFLRALMAGILAAELAPGGPAGEDAFLGAMFQNLGRLLTEYYLPEEALQIRLELGNDQAPAASREAAAQRVLGIGFDELGAGVARVWCLPESLQRALRSPGGDWPSGDDARLPQGGVERLRWLGRAANGLVDAMLAASGDSRQLAEAIQRHAGLLQMPPVQVMSAILSARRSLLQSSQALGMKLPPGSLGRRLLDAAAGAHEGDSEHGRWEPTAPAPLPPPAQGVLQDALASAQAALAARTMDVGELLHLILDSLHRALNLRTVVLCLREAGTGQLVGRVGLGPGGAEASAAFRIQPDAAASQDLLAVVCARGADLLVADAATVAARLPAWYRRRVDAPTFLLLPLMVKGQAIGLIYGDKARVGSLVMAAPELALVRALRDQVALAFGRTS